MTLGGTLALNSNVGGTTGPGSYKIATESGVASSSFSSVTGVPANLHANVNTGTSGSVFLDLYRLAAASTITPTTVTLTNIHAGGSFTPSALTVQNTASTDGYSEKLDAGVGGTTGSGVGSGSISLLSAGSTNNTNMTVGISDNTAGAKSGTVTVNLSSDGSGTSGAGTTSLTAQTITVSGKVYRLAVANSITTPISLGNVHVGGTFGTSALSINNTATNDGYSEGLDAAFGSLTGAASTNGGSISLLAAGGADSTSMTVGLGGAAGHGRVHQRLGGSQPDVRRQRHERIGYDRPQRADRGPQRQGLSPGGGQLDHDADQPGQRPRGRDVRHVGLEHQQHGDRGRL